MSGQENVRISEVSDPTQQLGEILVDLAPGLELESRLIPEPNPERTDQELLPVHVETDDPSEQIATAKPTGDTEQRRSTRHKTLTEKAQQNLEMEIENLQKSLNRHYQRWRQHADNTRKTLLTPATIGCLHQLYSDLERYLTLVIHDYSRLKGITTPDNHIVEIVDNCQAISNTLLERIMDRRLDHPENFCLSQERDQTRHLKLEHPSIFGDSITDVASVRSRQSNASTSSQKAIAEAELAEKRAKALALQAEAEQRRKIMKVHEEQMKLQTKAQEEEMTLKRIQAETEVKAAEAKARVLAEALEEETGATRCNSESHNATSLNPHSPSFLPIETQQIRRDKVETNWPRDAGKDDVPAIDVETITKLFSNALAVNRLPTPEPDVFTGNPLAFIQWSRTFNSLVRERCPSSADKLFYLQKYLGGEAKRALEGTFYRDDDEAYEQAWETLNARYGHPFIVLKAFREKLNGWPKIGPKDTTKLREFSDFVKACSDAIPHVPGLEVLNDYDQNQRLLLKLPDAITAKWNRRTSTRIAERKPYPSFTEFATFLDMEAMVANNPVSSWLALRQSEDKGQRSFKRNGAHSLSTSVSFDSSLTDDRLKHQSLSPNDKRNETSTCPFCKNVGHTLGACMKFRKKNLSERREFVKSQGRCYGCLRTGHTSRECQRKYTCATCKRNHPTCLHDDTFGTNAKRKPNETVAPVHRNVRNESAEVLNSLSGNLALSSNVVPVWLATTASPRNERLVYALLDTQSDATFVDERISNELRATSQPAKLKLTTLLGRGTEMDCRIVTGLQVRAFSSEDWIHLPPAYTSDYIPVERAHIPTSETAKAWDHLKCLSNEIPSLLDCDAGILIGYNCLQALIPREVISGKNDEPYAVKTDLGWSIVGNAPPGLLGNGHCHRISVKETPPVTPMEAIRILERDFQDTQVADTKVSQDDIFFISILEKGIRRNDRGHYEMPLPFKSRPHLPDNERTAMLRLKGLKRRLQRDPHYKEDYLQFMKHIFEEGHAEIANDEPSPGEVWYLPHHGVYHPAKPNKLRVVFDCSVRHGGDSLNDHLLTGPDLTNSLVGVLLRFRVHPVAVLCDVKKMFHQFQVKPEDRNFLRFLWWTDGKLDSNPVECRMTVHLFGAASSPGCANYGLKHLVEEHGQKYPLASQFILRNFYVDDGITSVPTDELAIHLLKEATALCAEGKLRLHKFVSNSTNVMEGIHPERRSTETSELALVRHAQSSEKALGMHWCTKKDAFTFSLEITNEPYTRRTVLSAVASLYDPLGLLAPFVLTGKRVLQATCRHGVKWDEPLPEKAQPEWNAWMSDLKNLNRVSIPRCYVPPAIGQPVTVQLHHFSDASTKGYGACSYLRVETDETQVHCALVLGKARVSPSKITTIPRLELSAAVTSAEMNEMLRRNLDMKINEEFFWTDSRVVLGYVNNEAKRFHVFVANRVGKIRHLTNPKQWRYVRSEENPADIASRGASIEELIRSKWFTGPDFLWEKDLTITNEDVPQLKQCDPEVRATQVLRTTVTATIPIDWESRTRRFSSWKKIRCGIARLLRRIKGDKSRRVSSVQERRTAELTLIRAVQERTFSQAFALLKGKTKSLPKTNRLFPLEPILEDGILRAGGRLKNALLSPGEINPIILPKESHVTRLIISHFHEEVKHQGRGMTLNELRANGYCMLGGSKTVASYIKRCVTCRKGRRPPEEQKMADLPQERLEASPPFWFSGMDCFGPYLVKRARSSVKCYGLLFTCFYSRAVHIEMLEDMTTDSFINGLRCFIAIRGPIREIRSDRGTNFVGASKELRAAMKEMSLERITAFLAETQCDLKFNAPRASHAGGLWERQIRTVKNVLKTTLDLSQGRLDSASLRTLFYEAMYVVNSRPLSLQGINDPTGHQPLTPNHLLTMRSSVALPPPGNFVKEDVYLKKRWRRVQFLVEQFWSRWKREYLYNISQRQKWAITRRNIQVGDIVLLIDNSPRNEWPLGRVVDVKTDEDGLVRRAKIQVATKKLDRYGRRSEKPSTLERPVQKLVLLLESH